MITYEHPLGCECLHRRINSDWNQLAKIRQLLWEELQELTTSETVLCTRLSCLRSTVNEDSTCNGDSVSMEVRSSEQDTFSPGSYSPSLRGIWQGLVGEYPAGIG